MEREDIKMLVKKWWDIYNDETLDYKKQPKLKPLAPVTTTSSNYIVSSNNVNGEAHEHVAALQPLIKQAISDSSRLQCVTAPSAA